VILAAFIAAAMAQMPTRLTRENLPQALVAYGRQTAMTRSLFDCVYRSDPAATASLVEGTDPYFFMDAHGGAFAPFQSKLIANGEFARCTVIAVQANGDAPAGQRMTLSLDPREYRDWAARRIYLDQYPAPPQFARLRTPERSERPQYGRNARPVLLLLQAFDCAAKTRPDAADWVIRNVDPYEIGGTARDSSQFKTLSQALDKCNRRHPVTNGSDELLNHSAGLMADSLLKMLPPSAQVKGGGSDA
jgi:hypothetical protein